MEAAGRSRPSLASAAFVHPCTSESNPIAAGWLGFKLIRELLQLSVLRRNASLACYAGNSPAAIQQISGPPTGDQKLVEAAGIEPASASPTSQALHAYSAFNLTLGYPADGEDLKPVR